MCGGAVDEPVREQAETNYPATVNTTNELVDDDSDVDFSRAEDPPGEGMAVSLF